MRPQIGLALLQRPHDLVAFHADIYTTTAVWTKKRDNFLPGERSCSMILFIRMTTRRMSDSPEAALPAAPCNALADARAVRLKKFERERLIVDTLNRGVSVAEIAAPVGDGAKRMHDQPLDRQAPVEGTAAFGASLVQRTNFAPQGSDDIEFERIVQLSLSLLRWGEGWGEGLGRLAAVGARRPLILTFSPFTGRRDAPAPRKATFAREFRY